MGSWIITVKPIKNASSEGEAEQWLQSDVMINRIISLALSFTILKVKVKF